MGAAPPGCLFPSVLLFLPLLDLICILSISSLNLVGPVALSCARFYLPVMVVVAVAVIFVVLFVNVVAVVILDLVRPPHVPLTPCHPPNGKNTKAWD